MNENKICFITCTNDEVLYEESVRYIRSLYVPDGFEVVFVSIRDAKSLTEGYNRAMKQSDAKYKVYLHQDTFIINKNFIFDVVNLFMKHSKLGMMGVVGAGKMPPNGKWWEEAQKFGKVWANSYTKKMELLAFNEIVEDYKTVEAIDGLIMTTQYDILWREDVFTDWHYYDASQTCEFIRAGLDVGVPRQSQPWCLHDCGALNMKKYDEQREIFIHEYSKDLFPLVSILIPTYNRPDYFRQALESVLNQTYKNIEIVICDDSTNDETEKLIKNYLVNHPNIRYYRNEKNLGQFKNDLKCMDLAKGNYVNFLMDDDLFHPEKIDKMMWYFIADDTEEISLITSHRQVIDRYGNHLTDWYATQRLFHEDRIIDGIAFGELLLKNVTNFIGEPTTVLFRRNSLHEQFGTFCGRDNGCTVDLASWLNLLSEGKIVYISETLSYFRIHEGQQLQSSKMLLLGRVDFAHQILNAKSKGFFRNNSDYLSAITSGISFIERFYPQLEDVDKQTKEYQELLLYDEILHKEKKSNSVINS
ncbi:glycosyltransferase [Paenibacillus dokdonensis]|uniref:glycosyltransferase n=1 Tax=Paenibacillus dokdonensis TaxID=2567944 RepID=UPI001FE9204F|nr:glycosyltransferase [Paenibacillus dokdonensis]